MVRWSKPSLYRKKKRVSVSVTPKDADSTILPVQTPKLKSKSASILNRRKSISPKDRLSKEFEKHAFCLSLETTHNLVRLCRIEIQRRGLHKVDIFKPQRIGTNEEEISLISTLIHKLSGGQSIQNDLEAQDVRKVVTVLKWSLRNCEGGALVPYYCYDHFVKDERKLQQESNMKKQSRKTAGAFNKFLSYLAPKNREILCELFELYALVLAHSHLNQMKMDTIAKAFAIFILSDNRKTFDNFSETHHEWTRCCNAFMYLLWEYLQLHGEHKIISPLASQPVETPTIRPPVATKPIENNRRPKPISVTVLKHNHEQMMEKVGWWDLLADSLFSPEDSMNNDVENSNLQTQSLSMI